VEHYLDKEKRLYLAKSFVLGSIINSEKLYQIDASEHLGKLLSISMAWASESDRALTTWKL